MAYMQQSTVRLVRSFFDASPNTVYEALTQGCYVVVTSNIGNTGRNLTKARSPRRKPGSFPGVPGVVATTIARLASFPMDDEDNTDDRPVTRPQPHAARG